MQIFFDPSTLIQSKMGSVTGVIYFDFGSGRKFPSEGWNDFVVVILNWWMAAVQKIVQRGEKAELRFMDGPYWISAVPQGPIVLLRCTEDRDGAGVLYEVAVGIEDLKRELLTFARQLSSACAQANIQAAELSEIKKALPN
jgi:hypothetical protein